ncbi:MAG: MoaD/ThiS family protein [Dehalococcoidales bacterium]|jgi:molybdopterin converting factor small subunit|nr:MoaD/ThiS family protein [Dehalococcoidales bacterium]
MSAVIHIHPMLRSFTGGQSTADVPGSTVGDCLGELTRRYPEVEKELFDENGCLLRHVDIYLNGESAFPDELTKPVADSDALHIVMMVVGG